MKDMILHTRNEEQCALGRTRVRLKAYCSAPWGVLHVFLLLLMMTVEVNGAWGQGPVEITTDTNGNGTIEESEKKFYLIQTNAFPSFYIAPQDKNNNNNWTITTNNILGEYMLWYFLDAGSDANHQYYYIVNNSTGKYIYNHNGTYDGTNGGNGDKRQIKLIDLGSLSDNEKEKCKFKFVEDNQGGTTGFYNIDVKANQTYYGLNKQSGSANDSNPIRLTNGQYIHDSNSKWKFVPFNETYVWPNPPFSPSTDSDKHFYKISNVNVGGFYVSTDETPDNVTYANSESDHMVWYLKEAPNDPSEPWYKYYYIINPETGDRYMYYNGTATNGSDQTNAVSVKEYNSENEDRYQFVVVQAAKGDGDKRVECYAIIPKLLKDQFWGSNSIGSASVSDGANMGIIKSRGDTNAQWKFESTDFSTVCANPTITFSTATGEVSMSTTTTYSTIRYTSDGTTTPSSTEGNEYTDPFVVTEETTIKAIVTKNGFTNSEVITNTIHKVATPIIQDNGNHAVSITSETEDATIYYTIDGTTPTTSSTEYTGPSAELSGKPIKAIAVKDGMINSAVASATVTLSCANPVFTMSGNNLTISCSFPENDVTIHYTINGDDPTESDNEYTKPISVAIGDVVKAIAVATGYNDSEVATYTYTLPVISYDYTTGKVSITSDLDGASIYYTINGSDPTNESTLFNEPFAISNGDVVKAIAIKDGTNKSGIATFTCAIPTITYDPTTRMATITPSAEGATIYYTINGGEPTSANNTYTGSFYVEDGETIRAKDDGESAVLTVVLTPIITLSETSYTYDKTAKEPTVESVKIGDTVIPTSEYTYSYSNNTNAGNATVTISNNSGGNYYVSGTKTFTINKKEVGLTWVESLPYNGTQQIPTVTATNLISGDECNVTVTIPGQHRNAGNYTATASALSNPNYQLPTERTHSFTITQRVADLQWATSTLTYNGQAQKPTATVSNHVEGDVCSVTVTGEQTNAGTYTATASALSNPNYQLPANVTTSFTINKATVNTSITITGWKYNSTPNNPSVTRNPGNGSVTYAYKVKDADDNTYTTTVPSNAGEYTVRATIAETDNYLEATPTANFTIAKIDRSPKPTITIVNRIYDGTNTAPTYSITGNEDGGDVTLEYEGDDETNWHTAPPTDAGHYQVRATIAATTNYNASVVMGDYRINKAEINPTLTITGWTYNKPGTITVSENPENGEVHYLYRQLEATPAKSYNTETEELTLTTTLTGATIYYTKDGTDPTSSSTRKQYAEPFIIDAAIVDNVKAIAITTTSSFRSYVPTEVGKYQVQATIEDTKNYNGKEVVAEFTIGPTDIDPAPTVILDGWTYGENPKSPYVDGNKGGGKVSYAYKVKDADNATYTATIPTNAGEYTVRATIDATNNYNSTTVTTNFTIAKADLSPAPLVHIDNWTYGGTASTPTIINNAGEGTVTYTYSVKGADSYSETVPTDAGDYTLKATIAGSTNYNSTVATRDFTINKATVIVTPVNYTKVYDEEDPELALSLDYNSGIANTDEFTGTLTRVSGEDVGNYAFSVNDGWTITAKDGGDDKSANYEPTIKVMPADFTITPKSIGDGITPADGFTLTISQTAGNWTVSLKKGDTPLNSSTDYNLTQYTRSIDGESYINSDEVDVVFDITGKGNYTGEVKGAKSAPRFYKYDEDTEKDYYITVYRNGSTADWLKPEEGPTAYTITSINLSSRELAITPLAYYPMGVPIVLMMETTHSAPAPNGYEVDGMKGKSGEPEKISSAEKQRNLLKVSDGVLSDPASAKVPEHVAAAQVYIYDKDKGEFVLALEGDLPIGTFYIDNPNYKPAEGGGGGTPAPQRLRIVRWNDTPVHDIERDDNYNNDSWYTIDGRRLQGEPTQHGIYLHNGKKVMMK